MAYTDDAVLAKLSALNETHDSIATAAQWIMFHRRHAERTVQLWFQRLKDSPSAKRLNLVYLANEVTQQSKARHKEDFVVAFSPVIAEAIAAAYKGAPSEVQNKLRRVVDVWRERSIFEVPIQTAVESRIEELDKAKGASRPAFGGGGGGGSIFGAHGGGAAIPSELLPLVAPQQSVTKTQLASQGSVSLADADFRKIMDAPPPAAPVYAARLNGLLKSLTNAEQAVGQMVQARTDLKQALETLLAACQAGLDENVQQLAELQQRKTLVDSTKRDVEDRIMRGLNAAATGDSSEAAAGGNSGSNGHGSGGNGDLGSLPDRGAGGALQEPQRPEMEALTPPPTEPDEPAEMGLPGLGLPGVTSEPPSVSGIDILSHLASQAVPVSTNGANKRRRVAEDEVPDLDDGIDADVNEALQQDQRA